MLSVLCLSPAIDTTISLPKFPRPGDVIKGANETAHVGGKGLNVARWLALRGERVRRLLTPADPAPAPFWLVVVHPRFAVSTRAVYEAVDAENFRLTRQEDVWENCARSVLSGDVRAASRSLFNGLQRTVNRLHPSTERFCTALGKDGALSTLLSGSGSAVFGLAESQADAERIRRGLPPEVWSNVVQTLPDGVMAAHGPLVP